MLRAPLSTLGNMPSGIDYYRHNAEQFFYDTVSVDTPALYAPFRGDIRPGNYRIAPLSPVPAL